MGGAGLGRGAEGCFSIFLIGQVKHIFFRETIIILKGRQAYVLPGLVNLRDNFARLLKDFFCLSHTRNYSITCNWEQRLQGTEFNGL